MNSWFEGVTKLSERDEEIIQAVCAGAELSKEEYSLMLDGVTLFDKKMNQETFKTAEDYTSLPYTLQKSAEFLKSTGMIDKIPENVTQILDDSFIR